MAVSTAIVLLHCNNRNAPTSEFIFPSWYFVTYRLCEMAVMTTSDVFLFSCRVCVCVCVCVWGGGGGGGAAGSGECSN